MSTLFNAMLDLAQQVTNVAGGIATGGTLTTLIDTTRMEGDDHFPGGTIFIASGASAGQSRKITGWVLSSHTFTFPSLGAGAPVGVGDLYHAAGPEYPREQLILAVNQALRDLHQAPTPYTEAAFLTVANQESYQLPANVFDIVRVEIARGRAEPYRWVIQHHWHEIADRIYFDKGYTPDAAGYPIRLWYREQLAPLTLDDDPVPDGLHPQLVMWQSAVNLYRWRKSLLGDDAPETLTHKLNEADARANQERRRNPPPSKARDVIFSGW